MEDGLDFNRDNVESGEIAAYEIYIQEPDQAQQRLLMGFYESILRIARTLKAGTQSGKQIKTIINQGLGEEIAALSRTYSGIKQENLADLVLERVGKNFPDLNFSPIIERLHRVEVVEYLPTEQRAQGLAAELQGILDGQDSDEKRKDLQTVINQALEIARDVKRQKATMTIRLWRPQAIDRIEGLRNHARSTRVRGGVRALEILPDLHPDLKEELVFVLSQYRVF